jgi:hypothetical protein
VVVPASGRRPRAWSIVIRIESPVNQAAIGLATARRGSHRMTMLRFASRPGAEERVRAGTTLTRRPGGGCGHPRAPRRRRHPADAGHRPKWRLALGRHRYSSPASRSWRPP